MYGMCYGCTSITVQDRQGRWHYWKGCRPNAQVARFDEIFSDTDGAHSRVLHVPSPLSPFPADH